ncbi:FIG042921: similarity to aminoacyl-tRNA editing enzymes YbaK, ProX [hydrothermal vent metagenome]|uniref:FIG042921: similarity to aminoacyl-tRNA editing enzymes YbaK, ProX n=1 Tax=hydrothermal vent metagenome TaxID=652676 RepID=A0A3B0RKD0_9ZZZZ
MIASRQQLFALLDELSIAHKTTDHRPIFTVKEGEDIKQKLPGGHSKNLFLKDKTGQLFLLSALGSTQIKLNQLHKVLGCKRLSFGRAELMQQVLGVTPGSVTAFALINDSDSKITFVLDSALLAHDPVNFHPLHNDATTAISTDDLLRFAQATGHVPVIVNFNATEDTSITLVSTANTGHL